MKDNERWMQEIESKPRPSPRELGKTENSGTGEMAEMAPISAGSRRAHWGTFQGLQRMLLEPGAPTESHCPITTKTCLCLSICPVTHLQTEYVGPASTTLGRR